MINKTVFAIAETIVPHSAGVPADTRAGIVADAAQFLRSRIDTMAVFLRIPMMVLIVMFELCALILCGRPFSGASIEQRKRYITRAVKLPLLHFGDLMKFMRSLMLLLYYSHPAVLKNIGYDDE